MSLETKVDNKSLDKMLGDGGHLDMDLGVSVPGAVALQEVKAEEDEEVQKVKDVLQDLKFT